jgi:hypothetical protein
MAKRPKKRPSLNIRISDDLLSWAKDYAKRNNTTVTSVVVGFLRTLREREVEVPQI